MIGSGRGRPATSGQVRSRVSSVVGGCNLSTFCKFSLLIVVRFANRPSLVGQRSQPLKVSTKRLSPDLVALSAVGVTSGGKHPPKLSAILQRFQERLSAKSPVDAQHNLPGLLHCLLAFLPGPAGPTRAPKAKCSALQRTPPLPGPCKSRTAPSGSPKNGGHQAAPTRVRRPLPIPSCQQEPNLAPPNSLEPGDEVVPGCPNQPVDFQSHRQSPTHLCPRYPRRDERAGRHCRTCSS